ncbi:MAG: 4-hydroxy-tetrahydrodipicolinate reductase, partial [Dehalococcoidia bacterium]
MIKVIVHGALGRMGQAVINAVCGDPELQITGAVDVKAERDALHLPDGAGEVPLSRNLESLLKNYTPDVMVDFTQHDAAMPAIRTATEHHVNVVVGTTGLSDDDFNEIDRLAQQHGVGAVVAPNFSLGAVLMMHLSSIAARFFDYAEIVEMHHEKKLDSPSGTAVMTAKEMAKAKKADFTYPESQKENLPGGRGAEISGIGIH